MGAQPDPGAEELEFIFRRFAHGADAVHVRDDLEDQSFTDKPRGKRLVTRLRKEFDAAKKVMDESGGVRTLVVQHAVERHLAGVEAFAKAVEDELTATAETIELGHLLCDAWYRIEGGSVTAWVGSDERLRWDSLKGHSRDNSELAGTLNGFESDLRRSVEQVLASPNKAAAWLDEATIRGKWPEPGHAPRSGHVLVEAPTSAHELANGLRRALLKGIVRGTCTLCPDR